MVMKSSIITRMFELEKNAIKFSLLHPAETIKAVINSVITREQKLLLVEFVVDVTDSRMCASAVCKLLMILKWEPEQKVSLKA